MNLVLTLLNHTFTTILRIPLRKVKLSVNNEIYFANFEFRIFHSKQGRVLMGNHFFNNQIKVFLGCILHCDFLFFKEKLLIVIYISIYNNFYHHPHLSKYSLSVNSAHNKTQISMCIKKSRYKDTLKLKNNLNLLSRECCWTN